jgi:hypothetical protein
MHSRSKGEANPAAPNRRRGTRIITWHSHRPVEIVYEERTPATLDAGALNRALAEILAIADAHGAGVQMREKMARAPGKFDHAPIERALKQIENLVFPVSLPLGSGGAFALPIITDALFLAFASSDGLDDKTHCSLLIEAKKAKSSDLPVVRSAILAFRALFDIEVGKLERARASETARKRKGTRKENSVESLFETHAPTVMLQYRLLDAAQKKELNKIKIAWQIVKECIELKKKDFKQNRVPMDDWKNDRAYAILTKRSQKKPGTDVYKIVRDLLGEPAPADD